jgi:hypothetical protein
VSTKHWKAAREQRRVLASAYASQVPSGLWQGPLVPSVHVGHVHAKVPVGQVVLLPLLP